MEEEKEFLIQIEDAQDVQSVKGNDKIQPDLFDPPCIIK